MCVKNDEHGARLKILKRGGFPLPRSCSSSCSGALVLVLPLFACLNSKIEHEHEHDNEHDWEGESPRFGGASPLTLPWVKRRKMDRIPEADRTPPFGSAPLDPQCKTGENNDKDSENSQSDHPGATVRIFVGE